MGFTFLRVELRVIRIVSGFGQIVSGVRVEGPGIFQVGFLLGLLKGSTDAVWWSRGEACVLETCASPALRDAIP